MTPAQLPRQVTQPAPVGVQDIDAVADRAAGAEPCSSRKRSFRPSGDHAREAAAPSPLQPRQSPVPASVCVHDVELAGDHESDSPAVGRPGRSASPARQRPLPASVGVHDVEGAIAPALEDDPPPVGRPGRGGESLDARHDPQAAAVGVHDVQRPAVAPAHESDPPAVGRPHRTLHLGPRRCALDESEEAIADAERWRDEQGRTSDDRDSDGNDSPAPARRAVQLRSDVYAEERTLPLERVFGKGTKLRDLGHFSAIPFSSISTSLCRECP